VVAGGAFEIEILNSKNTDDEIYKCVCVCARADRKFITTQKLMNFMRTRER
jgi:hypothetical protein